MEGRFKSRHQGASRRSALTSAIYNQKLKSPKTLQGGRSSSPVSSQGTNQPERLEAMGGQPLYGAHILDLKIEHPAQNQAMKSQLTGLFTGGFVPVSLHSKTIFLQQNSFTLPLRYYRTHTHTQSVKAEHSPHCCRADD